jgi:excisionase family DNA binding protein
MDKETMLYLNYRLPVSKSASIDAAALSIVIEEENKSNVNTNPVDVADLLRLDAAYDALLHKLYKKPYNYELVMKNKIPYHKVGNYTYFSLTELHQWLKHKKPKE